jgi:hypothetical protein|tara:strand:- start:1300 stop:1572 length:273 start_codon:yes stop_codon:yes gene_type:complete
MSRISPGYYDNDIQLSEIIRKLKLDFPSGNAIKYIIRHKKKNKEIDLLKAIWYISDILENDYGINAVSDIKTKIQFIEEDNIRSSNNTQK